MSLNQRLISRTLLAVLFLSIVIGLAYGAIEENLVYNNNTIVDSLRYDRFNTSKGEGAFYGSDSYMDSSPTNPNMFVYLCHPHLAVGQKIDLAYYSESRNLTDSILNYRPLVTYTDAYSDSNGTYYCGRIDMDISSVNALYPGRVLPLIYDNYTNNATNQTHYYMLNPLSQNLTGRYEVGVNVIAPPKTFYITPQQVFDGEGLEISRIEPHLLVSLVNASETSILEGQISPGGEVEYKGTFRGGEKVYINGLKSLEIRSYHPCDPLNESGYYIMNESKFNLSDSCILINSTSAVILNFGTELLDGDNAENGSMRQSVCAIDILNSRNITLENVIVQQFYKGICVTNSTLYVLGLGVTYNTIGAFVTDQSSVVIIDTTFANNDSEISSYNNSLIRMISSNISTATLKTDFRDTILRSVHNPPAGPLSRISIGQWAWYEKSSPLAYAKINFYYTIPLPNGVTTDNLSIYEYNGTYGLINNTALLNFTGNVTNTSMGWSNGSWKIIYTLISPSELLIIGPNTTNYSIFAPFGNVSPQEKPQPQPQPLPTPRGGGTSGGAAGAGPSQPGPSIIQTYPGMIELELVLPPNITIMQGEAGRVDFNLTDKSAAAAYNISIVASVPRGWDSTNRSIPLILPNQTIMDYFLLAPYEKALPATYYIPVRASTTFLNRTYVFTEKLLQVIVTPRGDLQRIKIIEYSPSVEMAPGTTLNLSFVAQNIGDMDLANITVRYNSNDCLKWVQGSNDMLRGEAKVISYLIHSDQKGTCQVDFQFYSKDKLVGFVPLTFIIRDKGLFSPTGKKILLVIILLGWTLLTAWMLDRRRRMQRK
jgi:hypothetical protein